MTDNLSALKHRYAEIITEKETLNTRKNQAERAVSCAREYADAAEQDFKRAVEERKRAQVLLDAREKEALEARKALTEIERELDSIKAQIQFIEPACNNGHVA